VAAPPKGGGANKAGRRQQRKAGAGTAAAARGAPHRPQVAAAVRNQRLERGSFRFVTADKINRENVQA